MNDVFMTQLYDPEIFKMIKTLRKKANNDIKGRGNSDSA